MTATFGPNEERKLLGAIKRAVAMVTDGSSPDEAIAKVAMEDGLHPDSVPLFVSAYNVGQQTHKREKCAEEGSGTSCLMSPHPIARIENVLGHMYPDKTQLKAAMDSLRAGVVDDCYSMSPAPLRAYEEEKKAELRELKLPAEMPSTRYAGEFLVEARQRLKQAAARAYENMDLALQQSNMEMIDKLGAVCGYFKQSYDRRITLAEAEYNSVRLFGPEVRGVFDVVAITRPKEARDQGIVHTTQAVNVMAEPYSLVKAAFDKVLEYVDDESHVRATKAKIASEVAKEDPFAVASGTQDTESLLKDLPEIPFSPRKKKAGLFSNLASGLTGGVAATMRSVPMPKPTSELVDDATDQLNDPEHLAEMRRVNARTLLANLMATDPVISGFDPSEVTDAFNEINQFSPNVATQGAAMRGLLRRRLAGGVFEAHDANQLADINKKLQPEPPAPQPKQKK